MVMKQICAEKETFIKNEGERIPVLADWVAWFFNSKLGKKCSLIASEIFFDEQSHQIYK